MSDSNRPAALEPDEHVVTFTLVVKGDASQIARIVDFVKDDGILRFAFEEHQFDGPDLRVLAVSTTVQ